MVSNKRLIRIKKELEKFEGQLIVINFKDGSELKVKASEILESLTKVDEETEFIKSIKGKEIVSCSSLYKLIHILKQLIED